MSRTASIPTSQEILEAVGERIDPRRLIGALRKRHHQFDVIEGIQRAIEREVIIMDINGFVIPTPPGTYFIEA